jgi:hypothetical protein
MLSKFSNVLAKSNLGSYTVIADYASEMIKVVNAVGERVFVTPFSPVGLGLARRELLLAAEILALELKSFEKVCQTADKGTYANRVRWLGLNIERTLTCAMVLQAKLEGIQEPWVAKVKADIERLLGE